jgi:hypothetical protein
VRAKHAIALRFVSRRIPAQACGQRRDDAAREGEVCRLAGHPALGARDLVERAERLFPDALVALVAERAHERQVRCERCRAVRGERPLIVEQDDPVGGR